MANPRANASEKWQYHPPHPESVAELRYRRDAEDHSIAQWYDDATHSWEFVPPVVISHISEDDWSDGWK